ncbi:MULTISPECIES: alpha/beta hydrolase [unclassified Beijerinckia]|uniref:alpha/beta fold hydrolase n=1 Tax=unclassified Beijerinckia TaxID=2638183 RepID=UPI0008999B5A|nr:MULTISPECIES: alpha/beta hydrolase [unclassified Beijerinckia]MDH7794810.1 pimeloyl-ACP methyl ester carboxylesterase [Beijerinckia sp. GAS462]SEB76034.1 Pimeloyl-ACP methyl ester carboxylesterase [Beijerinckia sp. 28-YEA-48]
MTRIVRRDITVKTIDQVTIAVREVRGDETSTQGTPILLMHGTRVPGISEFDLPVENGSVAETLALSGHDSFIPDARGFGRSDRPAAMSQPPGASRPLARCLEITRDVDATVDAMRETCGVDKVALLGWGVGATLILMYAALWPEKVSHLVLYNPLYGGASEHARYRGAQLADPNNPLRFNVEKFGGYNFNTLDHLLEKWDTSIPLANKDEWRDPAVAKAFVQALSDGDPTTLSRDPPTFRSPNGMLEDSFYIGIGEKLVHANQVSCKVLIVRGELDYFSRVEDVDELQRDLVNAEQVRRWEPKNATHYVLLDRPERGRDATLSQIVDFLRS